MASYIRSRYLCVSLWNPNHDMHKNNLAYDIIIAFPTPPHIDHKLFFGGSRGRIVLVSIVTSGEAYDLFLRFHRTLRSRS